MANKPPIPQNSTTTFQACVPYLPSSTHPFHTLDIWYQNPTEDALWVIFIHGGAWRDPTQTKLLGHPLLTHLLEIFSSFSGGSGGRGQGSALNASSIDYRLSAHPVHPAVGETVIHPAHLEDVQAALKFLSSSHNMRRYLLIGHSAGATLALQSLVAAAQNRTDNNNNNKNDYPAPEAIVCLEGIYDIPALVDEYPDYKGFIEGAFGPVSLNVEEQGNQDTHPWKSASPTREPVYGAIRTWYSGDHRRKIVLVHSMEDELLSRRQLGLMEEAVVDKGIVERSVELQKLEVVYGMIGGHDEVLKKNEVWMLIQNVVRDMMATQS